MWINHMTTLPLLVRHRHALLGAEVRVTVIGPAIVMAALLLWLAMAGCLVRWAIIMPVGGPGCAKLANGALSMSAAQITVRVFFI
jgi:hypothetical protein